MNLFKRSVLAGLKSKTFGNAIYFFDKEDVVVIAHDGKLTYTVRKDYGSEGYCLITEIAPRKSITCDVGNLNNMFIIPEIEKRQDARLLKKVEDGNLCAKEYPETIFEIRDYGLLDLPNFEGCNFSKSKINVLATNPQGEYYEISFVVGEGVKACDGNPKGEIPDAYHFKPLGTLVSERELHIQL